MSNNNLTVEIPKTCIMCGVGYTLTVPKQGFEDWYFGKANIQDAMPNLTPGERELLISGICETCFDKIFKEDA